MLTLHKYISRELLKGFLLAFLVLMLIIFVGFSLRFAHDGLDIIQMKLVFPHIALQTFPYCVPLSLLISVIMVYGRMSGDNEITALRSSGIHLQTIVTPTMLIAVLFSVVSFFVISNMVPMSERKIHEIVMDARTWLSAVDKLGTSVRRIRLPGWLIYVVGKKEDGMFQGISIYKVSREFVSEIYDAKRGRIERVDPDGQNDRARIYLEEGTFVKREWEHKGEEKTIRFTSFDVCIPINQMAEEREYHEPKYLSLDDLRKTRKKLRARIATHGEAFEDPVSAAKKFGEERDEQDKKNSAIQGELQGMKDKLARIDKDAEAAKRELAEYEVSKKEWTAHVAVSRKDWQRLKQKLDAETAELDRKREDLRKLLEKSGAASPGNGASEEPDKPAEPAALSADDDKLARSIRRDIAALTANRLRLEGEVATARRAYDADRARLADVKKRIHDVQTTLDNCTLVRGALQKGDTGPEARKAQLEDGHKRRDELDALCRQAKEQQQEYEFRIMVHMRIALSFSCICFVMTAIPLGIYSRHGHVLIAFAIGLALVLAYFGLFLMGRTLADGRYLQCEAALWGANVITGFIGLLLMISVFRK